MERKLVIPYFRLILIVLLCTTKPTFSANPLAKAEHEEFWNGMSAVVIGSVRDVGHSLGTPIGSYNVLLDVRACIAGLINPALHPNLVFDYNVDGTGDRETPRPGDLILVVLTDRAKLLGSERTGFGVGGRCSFMPDARPLVVLKGMDDPVILDVLRKMQAARPTTAPATRPTNSE